ncbi:hypothetical protein PT015_06140 [Candidatus Mycobacterium wuenschmannii]|uniref:DUF4352 domain-containing protein n=1 Tax=Candidatus Mycobacterium wuenschmannii TaxID=3027808 RepID=A0ABY8W3Q5_9MYCO|nr:hypothetical protein [Candidatus Mycobacterium wuenschmannii]WIM89048.1 hypothetical protein PT015_06140 [Candidatus Mycobacterium wuenschmannii]
MSGIRDRLARHATLPATAVLIAASAWLWHHLPVPTQVYAPFDVHGALGAEVRGKEMAVTVTGVRVAPKGKFATGPYSSRTMSATGVWLVVDATLSAIESSTNPAAELRVGQNTYMPSMRPAPGYGVRVDPGLPQHGHWVFDVAPELLAPKVSSPLQLLVHVGGEDRLSSQVVIDLDTRPLERSDKVTVQPYEIGPAQ